jgi:platelet-activating factor acetylhydrolase
MMDAPLIEPTLLSWAMGATMDPHESLLQYVNLSVDFMRHVNDGGDISRGQSGVLGEPVSHPQYEEESRPLPPELAKYWQVHVSPVS